jgi:hypothetical protein
MPAPPSHTVDTTESPTRRQRVSMMFRFPFGFPSRRLGASQPQAERPGHQQGPEVAPAAASRANRRTGVGDNVVASGHRGGQKAQDGLQLHAAGFQVGSAPGPGLQPQTEPGPPAQAASGAGTSKGGPDSKLPPRSGPALGLGLAPAAASPSVPGSGSARGRSTKGRKASILNYRVGMGRPASGGGSLA